MFLSNHHSEYSFQPGDDLNIEESEMYILDYLFKCLSGSLDRIKQRSNLAVVLCMVCQS